MLFWLFDVLLSSIDFTKTSKKASLWDVQEFRSLLFPVTNLANSLVLREKIKVKTGLGTQRSPWWWKALPGAEHCCFVVHGVPYIFQSSKDPWSRFSLKNEPRTFSVRMLSVKVEHVGPTPRWCYSLGTSVNMTPPRSFRKRHLPPWYV